MSMILIILLVVLLMGALPTYSYSRTWGYAPSGGLLTVLLVATGFLPGFSKHF